MKTISATLLSLLALVWGICPENVSAQENKAEWSAFSSGFGVSNLLNSVLRSSVAQAFAGRSQMAETVVESGFLVHPFFYGPLVGIQVDEPLPLAYALHQNYPNPFNPSTTIKFQVPITTHITLKVFDLLGREVANLVNEVKPPGAYAVQWEANGVASGVYFYRLHAESFVDTKRLVLLK